MSFDYLNLITLYLRLAWLRNFWSGGSWHKLWIIYWGNWGNEALQILMAKDGPKKYNISIWRRLKYWGICYRCMRNKNIHEDVSKVRDRRHKEWDRDVVEAWTNIKIYCSELSERFDIKDHNIIRSAGTVAILFDQRNLCIAIGSHGAKDRIA